MTAQAPSAPPTRIDQGRRSTAGGGGRSFVKFPLIPGHFDHPEKELLHHPIFERIIRRIATQPWRSTVRLIGIFLSPYVRRVAISLNLLNLPFEADQVFVFGEPDVVRRYNPLVRIPALVLDDGTNLVESGAILDEIDHMVSSERRLTPSDGPLRRRVLQAAAMALGCADKAQWAFYEDRVRPAEKVHIPWIEHNDSQVLGGFEHLNVAAAQIDDDGWIAGTPQISQADVTTTAAFTFANLARPHLELSRRFPQLARFVGRCEALPAFLKAPLPTSARLSSVLAKPFVS